MLQRISSTHLRTSIINQVCSSLSPFFPLKLHQFFAAFLSNSSSSNKLSNTHFNSSPVSPPFVGNLVFSKCSHLWDHRIDKSTIASSSINQLILNISYVSPKICRKFLRVLSWKPEDVLEILLGFQLGSESLRIDVEVVESLWEIFRRVDDRNVGFKHLPQSYEVMASMLVNKGMFGEVESLLSTAKTQGILLANEEVFSRLVEGYANMGELDRAFLMYDAMKGLSLAPSLACYRSLLSPLMKEGRVDQAIRVYEDVVEVGFNIGDVEPKNLENLISFLCWDGKIREARKLLKKIVVSGWKPNTVILSKVADVYYEKKDFEDLLSFFVEMKCAPDIFVGNKIIRSLCSNFGIGRADSFLWELERLGFVPNEITFGIFISWSCLDGAFFYLSEILSRGLKPDRHSYNALISGLFKAGMQEHAREIFNEMIGNGVKPNLATFRALLAGYSNARLFNEVELMMSEMVNHGLITLPDSENPISKAFAILGLNPLTVKLKRDNDVKSFRTEFVDTLGNGLYLDTNVDEFEKTVMGVLEDSLVPDFNLLVMRQCSVNNVKEALLMVDEMLQWGQEFSLPALSVLVRLLCESNCHIKAIPALLDKVFQRFGELDCETLNCIIKALGEGGFVDECRLLLQEMYRRHLPISNTTYTATIVAFCKLGSMSDILYCWGHARKDNWSPEWGDFIIILENLCHRRMLEEVLGLFDIMLAADPDLQIQICDVFFEKLSSNGLTCVGDILVKELKRKNFELDHTVYSRLIKGYCLEKRFSEALMTFDEIRADNLALSPDALMLLIPKLCKFNRFKEAVALIDAGFKDHPSVLFSLHSALVIGCCRAGKVAVADGLFQEMFLQNNHPKGEIYNSLLQARCQSGNLKTAKELFCVMMKRSINLSVFSYRDLIYLLCKVGMLHFLRGLKNFMAIGNNTPYSLVHNIFTICLFRTEKHHLVDALLDELEESRQQLDEVGYNILIHGFSVCKDMPRSMKFLNDMIIKGLRPSNRSLRAVIRYLCKNGEIQNALELSNQIESRGWCLCPTVHFAILEGLFSCGRIHQAERFLAQFFEKGSTSETSYYNNLIRNFCNYGRLETAVNLLDQILKNKSIPDASSYDCVVQSFCVYNNLDCAMDFFNEMFYRNLRPSIGTWDILIQKFCKNGQTKDAECLLISMIEVGETPTKRMYSSVIDRYQFENNLSKASELLNWMQRQGYEPDFGTQWSLISSLSYSNDRKSNNDNEGFLSKLLVKSGFPLESPKSKLK
ncbi:pentatricopeptide repeat-containing protein At5g15280-like [Chenopodium quinoa]|uniref:Pentatricopeptide repeat-containing protein n=1 Tax=Chenopodium quinoa TaxID=63459 RepID=A0A803LSA7_CHEQI|nr:pentatricopeptide repeat-containing protein At5g15280-like [Chenopodium quinoa]